MAEKEGREEKVSLVERVLDEMPEKDRNEYFRVQTKQAYTEIRDRQSAIEHRDFHRKYTEHCYIINYHCAIFRTVSSIALVAVALILYFK